MHTFCILIPTFLVLVWTTGMFFLNPFNVYSFCIHLESARREKQQSNDISFVKRKVQDGLKFSRVCSP